MGFKIAVILNDVTDFSPLENSLKGMNVEFLRRHCQTEQEIIATAGDADYIITITHRYPYTRRVLEESEKVQIHRVPWCGP